MERISFDPDQMERVASTLRDAADRLAGGTARVRTAAACCCAPPDIAGWMSQAAGSVTSRVDVVADGLRTDGAELAQRSDMARNGQDPDGALVAGAVAGGSVSGGAAVDPVVAAAIVVVQALLLQLIAAHTPAGAAAPSTAVIGGTGGPGYTIVAGDGSVVTGGAGALLGPSVVGGTSSGFTSGGAAPTIGTVGGDDGLGMTITSGGPTSTADLSAALAGAGGTIGGSSGPDGVGPQYSDPGQADRLAKLDALLNAPRSPVFFGPSTSTDPNSMLIDANSTRIAHGLQDRIANDIARMNPNLPLHDSSQQSLSDYERQHGLRSP